MFPNKSRFLYVNEERLNRMDKRLKELIQFIQEHENWLELLKAPPYNLRIRQNPKKENQYIFSYDMIKSNMSLDIVKVSRGLILEIKSLHLFDESKDYRIERAEIVRECNVIVRAFDKFFNYGEGNADEINWDGKIYAFEKLDGSLIKYTTIKDIDSKIHHGVWHRKLWTTNNGFDASASLPGDLICEHDTFQDLIDEAIKNWDPTVIYDMKELGKEFVFIFEITSPFNRVVVPYTTIDLWWLGCRHKETGKEYLPRDLLHTGMTGKFYEAVNRMLLEIKQPKLYELTSKNLNEVVEIVSKMGSDNEGIVVVDENFNRIKIKGEAYLSIHRMKDGNGQLSTEHILKCIQNETIDDILGMFPEYVGAINEVVNLYKIADNKIDEVFYMYDHYIANIYHVDKDGPTMKKEFAMKVKDSPFSKIYFNIYKYGKLPEIKLDYLKGLDYDSLKKLAGRT